MSYKYNPNVTELRQAYEVAYGDMGVYSLIGAMFAHLDDECIEMLYRHAIEDVKYDLKEKGLV